MPLLSQSSFSPPLWTQNPHFQTCLPRFLRRLSLDYHRERLELPDGDFVDIDSLRGGNPRAVILSHGLEGSSQSLYILGMARAFHENSYDVFCWNYRGCSGELNRLARSYHSGATDDLQSVIDNVAARGYRKISLIGFSLGANLTLKYLGERDTGNQQRINRAVVFSAPCDLAESAGALARPSRRPYMHYFAQTLREKLTRRIQRFPELGSLSDVKRCKTFYDFDSFYTAPAHGFASAEEYWAKNSARFFLQNIQIPTLIVNAVDDPCLGPRCSPREIASNHHFVNLELPRSGGHNGFFTDLRARYYWSELRAIEFLGKDSLPGI